MRLRNGPRRSREDSIYLEDGSGPYCEDCYQRMTMPEKQAADVLINAEMKAAIDSHAEINELLQWLETVKADESRDHEMRVTYGVAARVVRNYIETRGLWPNEKLTHGSPLPLRPASGSTSGGK